MAFRKVSVTILSLLFFANLATAQEAPVPYCETGPEFSQFDFWVGDWDVYLNNQARPLVGHNTITKLSNGCLIMESWLNASGTDGYSLRHYNPAAGTWQMFWVSDGYTVKTEGGQVEPGVMLLEGDIHYFASGQVTGFRVRFTAGDDGTVRQFAEQYNPETEAWDLWFDGIYERSTTSEDNT